MVSNLHHISAVWSHESIYIRNPAIFTTHISTSNVYGRQRQNLTRTVIVSFNVTRVSVVMRREIGHRFGPYDSIYIVIDTIHMTRI